jgi:Predicted metal-dependent hydrolase with the TIM-barrel fold
MRKIVSICLTAMLFACNNKEKADLLIYNATVYTVDSAFTITEAIAMANGKILATGTSEALKLQYQANQEIDASGQFIYPGFIDAHAHFFNYGLSLQTVDLTGTTSWNEILEKLKTFAATHTEGWLTGRGWDQNDWPEKEFPTNEQLNTLFPDRPVLLRRIDGHAAIANQKALELAGIHAGQTINGGSIETKNGQLTGLLIDNAIGLVGAKMPRATMHQVQDALLQAQANCFAVGLTTIDDCGLDFDEIEAIDSLQQAGLLKMRIYALLSDDVKNYDYMTRKGIIKNDRLHVRGFKVYADGALGSRGACLLQPYTDRPGWNGFLLSQPSHFDSVARILYDKDLQMCTHAIGDSGNRMILHTYAKYLKDKNDKRWRVEHAQVINKNDLNLFGRYSIIPSVQPTHATSDMYWAADRLGHGRVKGAYAYKELLQQNGWLPLGTDFPVEDIAPVKTFYAAVVRKDAKGYPEGGYQPENALSREAALRGMTIWAARSNFEEKEKGSLEKGKWADLVITGSDLMKAPDNELLSIRVLATYVAGEKVFEQK